MSSDCKTCVVTFINSWVFTVVDEELWPREKKVHFVMEKEHHGPQMETSRQLILKRLQVAKVCDQTLKEDRQFGYLKSKKILGLR